MLLTDGAALGVWGVEYLPPLGGVVGVARDVADCLAGVAEGGVLFAVGRVGYMDVRVLPKPPVHADTLLSDEFSACLRPLLHHAAVLLWVLLLQRLHRMEAGCAFALCRLDARLGGLLAAQGVIVTVLLADTLDLLRMLVADGAHVLRQSEVALEAFHGGVGDTEYAHQAAVHGVGVEAAEVLLQFRREVVGLHAPHQARRHLVAGFAFYLRHTRGFSVSETHRA